MLGACRQTCEYEYAPKCQLVQCACVRSREAHTEAEKGELWLPPRAGLSYGQFTDVQINADAQVRKLEELRFKKNIQLSTTLLASGLTDKMENRTVSEDLKVS